MADCSISLPISLGAKLRMTSATGALHISGVIHLTTTSPGKNRLADGIAFNPTGPFPHDAP